VRVVHVSASDIRGGAARAAFRSHQALLSAGVDSHMLVQERRSDAAYVHAPRSILKRIVSRYVVPRADRVINRVYLNRDATLFHSEWVPTDVTSRAKRLVPDILNLHWVCNGFVRVEAVAQFGVPVVWTLHDMWPFTGGCHYNGECRGFELRCGNCQQLGSRTQLDLSRLVWARKQRAWAGVNLTVVAPSRWLADEARRSSLFRSVRIEVVPNGIDLQRYRPMDRVRARESLELPRDAPLILFGAAAALHDRRKGFDLLQQALSKLRGSVPEDARLVVFGNNASDRRVDFGLPVHYQGVLTDEAMLARLYAAADVFVAPSRQDNLPNTVLEAVACGTPCVAFDTGGLRDLIDTRATGWLAKPFDTEDLARGIAWVLAHPRATELSAAVRLKAERELGTELHAKRMLALYNSLIAK
jgi:glycosyltransferase involved in cell wall biosynthesis